MRQASGGSLTLKKKGLLYVDYSPVKTRVYHQHSGGLTWVPTVPKGVGRPGDLLTITVGTLDQDRFVSGLPRIAMENQAKLPWVGDSVRTTFYKLDGERITIGFSQEPSVEGCSRFTIIGNIASNIHFHLGTSDIRFTITDPFGQKRELAVYHKGHSSAWFGIRHGREFYRICFAS